MQVWWQEDRIPGTEVTLALTPTNHFCGRGVTDRCAVSRKSKKKKFEPRTSNDVIICGAVNGEGDAVQRSFLAVRGSPLGIFLETGLRSQYSLNKVRRRGIALGIKKARIEISGLSAAV